jgi:DNA ligase-1
MKQFIHLIQQLDQSTSTNDKVDAIVKYCNEAISKDIVWTIALFSGRRPKRIVKTSLLKQWCCSKNKIEEWLFEECYHTVGDLAETIALLNKTNTSETTELPQTLTELIQEMIDISGSPDEEKHTLILKYWSIPHPTFQFIFNKLITGGFRIGISEQMVIKGLSKFSGIEISTLTHRLSGKWEPTTTELTTFFDESSIESDDSKPYPFYLAYALEHEPTELGSPSEWLAEWKWDGIRGQIIIRNQQCYIWSRGEELVTDQFPELKELAMQLPDGTVIDGEIICKRAGKPLPFSLLQTRLGRKKVSKKLLQDAPVGFFAYDLLEAERKDLRNTPLLERKILLESFLSKISSSIIQLSPIVQFDDWNQLASLRLHSREMLAEGFMIKRKDSPYLSGRKRGDWWKWKVDPLTIDAVIIYAQKGHGRRSNLFTDYTFAVRDGEKWIPFAKAYSGLTDAEFNEVDQFVKKHAIEKFGPVRTVPPELVFEIAFEGISVSKRHKCGIAVRFPRIHRWRKDKPKEEANTIEDLRALLKSYGN